MPERIQRRRTPGWRMPNGAVNVTRPGRWGNPFRVVRIPAPAGRQYVNRWRWTVLDGNGVDYREPPDGWVHKRDASLKSVELFAADIEHWCPDLYPPLSELRGKDLACWCPLSDPCHGDVLLHLANQGQP